LITVTIVLENDLGVAAWWSYQPRKTGWAEVISGNIFLTSQSL